MLQFIAYDASGSVLFQSGVIGDREREEKIDVLEDLVASGDLDPGVIAEMPTFTLHGASVEWTPSERVLRSLWPATLSCPNAYLCALDPDAQVCAHGVDPSP